VRQQRKTYSEDLERRFPVDRDITLALLQSILAVRFVNLVQYFKRYELHGIENYSYARAHIQCIPGKKRFCACKVQKGVGRDELRQSFREGNKAMQQRSSRHSLRSLSEGCASRSCFHKGGCIHDITPEWL
jgi:hypothetical protein